VDVAISYNNLGFCYQQKGEYIKAINFHKNALNIRIKLLGKKHSHVSWSYENIGNCYTFTGNFSLALEFLYKSLEIRLNIFSENNLLVASTYSSIGTCYSMAENNAEALKYLRKSTNIRLNILGQNHPVVAMSYINIGAIFHDKLEPDSAIYYFNKAKNILETANFDGANVYLCPLYINLGNAYQSLKNDSTATIYEKKGLDLAYKIYGIKHPVTATSLLNIGINYDNQDKYEVAYRYYVDALNSINYDKSDLEISLSNMLALKTLGALATIQRLDARLKNDFSLFQTSNKTYKEAINVIQYIRKNITESDSRDFTKQKNFTVYEGNIFTNLIIYNHTKSFFYLQDAFFSCKPGAGRSFNL